MIVIRTVIMQVIGILIIVLLPFYATASSYLECIGIITVKHVYAKDHTKKVLPNGKERFMVADILVHSHTFNCKGHSASMPIGIIKKVKLSLTPNIDISPKQGDHFNVLYQYSDSVAQPPEYFISNSSWTVNRQESSVPYIKKSDKKELPKVNISPNQVIDVNKDDTSLRASDIKTIKYQMKTYHGSYFEIKFPNNFLAKPIAPMNYSIINETEETTPKRPSKFTEFVETDEAYFTSPDGLVEFFVYSPQWSGKPKNYLDIRQDEKLLKREREKSVKAGVYQDYIQTNWVTIQAKNGEYTRSYIHQRACHGNQFADCLTHIFGIQYVDKKSYQKYRTRYIAFKKSLVQSTD